MRILLALLLTGCIFCPVAAWAQKAVRVKQFQVLTDSIAIDTLSIVPQTVSIKADNAFIPATEYQIFYEKALLVWNKKPAYKQIEITYQVYPVLFSRQYYNKDPKLIGLSAIDNSPYVYQVKKEDNTLFNLGTLQKSGSISRSIGFGNNQDLTVNSNMVLQLSGKLSNDVEIIAAISDDNLPIQPEGNTQQINDFDKVFIQLKRFNTSLIAGDFELRKPDSYFMNFFKRTQGAEFITSYKVGKWQLKNTAAAAIAKGTSARKIFTGTEGNQGPYRLTGNNGEQYIIILSGTERIYLDGQLLTRGQENDYIIDYNSAELTFTPRHIITQNSRINVEFEYSDKNYSRTLTYFNQEAGTNKLALKINYYNEQDNPNQPFLQDLSTTQKQFLKGIGNNINQAFFPNIDTVTFNPNEILYKKIDTLGNNGVYVYSTNPAQAKYRLGFSLTGTNNGNYQLNTSSAANGRVYEFIAPINGVKQGSYEPITLLITPKKQQLFTVGADYKVNRNTSINTEIALSNNDVNLFSVINNTANQGLAYKVSAHNEIQLSKRDSLPLKLISNVNFEVTSQNFKALERYRPVEFERDFNLAGLPTQKPEQLGSATVTLFLDNLHQLSYLFNTFIRSQIYTGVQNGISGVYQYHKYRVSYFGNLLNSTAIDDKGYIFSQTADLSRQMTDWEIGLNYKQRVNDTQNKSANALDLSSNSYSQYLLYVNGGNKSENKYHLQVSRRYDRLPSNYLLKNASIADMVSATVDLNKNPNSIFSLTSTYRTVNYTQMAGKPNESTLLGRAEYSLNKWKGFLNSYTYYELGTGQEPKREFTYLEVPAGQGAYTWIDYNNNNVKELNEFEIARYQDQATYIRIFQITNQFIRTNYTSINQTLRLTPAILLKDKKHFVGFISKISSQTEFKIDRKFTEDNKLAAFNPFDTSIDALNLVSLNSFLKNTVFFNRNNPVYSIDFNVQQNGSKLLLTNGFDTRKKFEEGVRIRWNAAQKISLSLQSSMGNRSYSSELFATKDFFIRYTQLSPQVDYLINTNLRLTWSASYNRQKNQPQFGGEQTKNIYLSTESRYNILKQGVITGKFTLVRNNYSGTPNSPVAYEMLDGLQPGNNLVWEAGFQRSIANGIQLGVNYQGRKSPTVRTIHTGGVQVRAFF